MSKKTLLQIITHHRQNPLDFIIGVGHKNKTGYDKMLGND
jgi:hypothetical protein